MHIKEKEKEIYSAYTLKHDSTREKQIILLMIPNAEKEVWHYLAWKTLSALLYRITSKNKGDFYGLNCLHSSRTENKFKSSEKVCKNKDFYRIVMLSEKGNILEFNQCRKWDKMSYVIYVNIESLIKIIDEFANNPENSSKTKIREHIPCRYSMSTMLAFDNIENKHTVYLVEDCMKKFCTSLRGNATNVTKFKKKKIKIIKKKLMKN